MIRKSYATIKKRFPKSKCVWNDEINNVSFQNIRLNRFLYFECHQFERAFVHFHIFLFIDADRVGLPYSLIGYRYAFPRCVLSCFVYNVVDTIFGWTFARLPNQIIVMIICKYNEKCAFNAIAHSDQPSIIFPEFLIRMSTKMGFFIRNSFRLEKWIFKKERKNIVFRSSVIIYVSWICKSTNNISIIINQTVKCKVMHLFVALHLQFRSFFLQSRNLLI